MHALDRPEIRIDTFASAPRSLRVAYVTETWPPELNGVALTAARRVQGLQRRGHAVQLVRPRQSTDGELHDGLRLQEVLMRGLPIPRYPQLRMGLPAQRELRALWGQQRPDVVHVATEGPLGWSALQAALHLRLPVTSDLRSSVHAHCRHRGVAWLHKPVVAYLRRFHNRALATLVPTAALRDELQAAGFQRLQVVARGVDSRAFAPHFRSPLLRQSWGADDDDLVVLCVGRLAAAKNLELALQAFEAIQREQPRARLVLVGDGPLCDALAQRAPYAHFAGQRRGVDLAAHYASADLFLFPSLTETFGNVTAEAMASALPVVAFDHAAAAQLIRPGIEGTLVPCGDAGEFVRAALQNARSAAHRRALGERARQRALQHDWEAVIARFEFELMRASLQSDPPSWRSAGIASAVP